LVRGGGLNFGWGKEAGDGSGSERQGGMFGRRGLGVGRLMNGLNGDHEVTFDGVWTEKERLEEKESGG